MIFYTADLHLGHENVIKFSSRPFSSLEEMDKTLIENWRAAVQPEDDINVPGDLIYKAEYPKEYLGQITGHIHNNRNCACEITEQLPNNNNWGFVPMTLDQIIALYDKKRSEEL